MKQLLAQQELLSPFLFHTILTSIRPILSMNKLKISMKTLCAFTLNQVEMHPELYNELRRLNKKQGTNVNDDDDEDNVNDILNI
jgi:hypothetical protein